MAQSMATQVMKAWDGSDPCVILAQRDQEDGKISYFGLPQHMHDPCTDALRAMPIAAKKYHWVSLEGVWYLVVWVDKAEQGEVVAKTVYSVLRAQELRRVACFLYGMSAEWLSSFYLYCALQSYVFDAYLRPEHPERQKLFVLESLALVTDTELEVAPVEVLAEMVHWSRDMCNEPSNVCTPRWMVDQVVQRLSPLGVRIEVLEEEDLVALGMHALLGVAKGSEEPPRVVVMHYQKGPEGSAPVVLLGKGVCFDSGGLSLKPALNMGDMKDDMAGASVVAATMGALAKNKIPVNVIGLIGLVENMPSGRAQKPGDIVRSLSGQTIEINNTDAEGRLVLCDLMWYAQSRFQPKCMVDLATLTGAIVVALGHEYAGLFSNNETLAAELLSAGIATKDLLWRMPMCDAFDRLIDAKVADIDNSGPREASSCTAAHFLGRFANHVPWAHLDIAGVAFLKSPTGTSPIPGATGFGVHLLYHWLAKMTRGAY